MVSIISADTPHVDPEDRVHVTDLGRGFHQVELNYGFMEPTLVADDLNTHLGVEPDDHLLLPRPRDRTVDRSSGNGAVAGERCSP